MIARAEIAFKQGNDALLLDQPEEARAAFDGALEYFLNAPDSTRTDAAFLPAYDELCSRISALEFSAHANDPADAADRGGPAGPASELTPAELALAAEPALLSPEEAAKLNALIAEAMIEKKSDVPIVLNDQVFSFLKFYQGPGREVMQVGLNRSGRYQAMMRAEFAKAGLPQDLFWIGLVESSFKTEAYSHANARGIWQFIPSTGRMYGLKIEPWVDERSDPEKSVKAAIHFFKDLYDQLGDWPSVMAAYNGGAGHILKARRHTHSTDFFQLSRTRYIPRETRGYVPIIMAAIIIAKDPARFGFSPEPDLPLRHEQISVTGPVRLTTVAPFFGMPVETLRLLNPELTRDAIPAGPYPLKIPEGSGVSLREAAGMVPTEALELPTDSFGEWNRLHRVRRGQSLASLARRYGVSLDGLAAANRLSPSSKLHSGMRLRVPGRRSHGKSRHRGGSRRSGRKSRHPARRGKSHSRTRGRSQHRAR